MITIVLYVIFFFVITLLIQFFGSKRKSKGKVKIWEGTNTIVVICILGIITQNINYLSAIIGFVIADQIGKIAGWHK